MSRINTNIPAMIAARILDRQNRAQNLSLERLSTGLRINTGKDDPAGLIASEALRAEIVAINAAIGNVTRANNVVATGEAGLDEVNRLLTELESLVDRSANEGGISEDELSGNQLQIDSILDSINRIANSTMFQGKKLLDGSLGYTTSGVSTADFTNVDITSARFPNDGYRNVVVTVTQSAQQAKLVYGAAATGAGTTTIEIKGNLGAEVLSFASATAISAVAAAINQSRELTGVSAAVTSATGLTLNSVEFGADEFVSVDVLEGTFALVGGVTQDFGQDVGALINGIAADADGLDIRTQTTSLALALTLSESFATTVGGTSQFQVTGGGANFAISPTVSIAGMASLGVRSVSTGSLGSDAVGFLSSLGSGQANALSSGNFATAQRIIRQAQTQVARLRGRLGAFQKDTLEATSNALQIALENTTAAESAIRDTDFARETSELTRRQILVQSATSVLRIANAAPQQVLALLS